MDRQHVISLAGTALIAFGGLTGCGQGSVAAAAKAPVQRQHVQRTVPTSAQAAQVVNRQVGVIDITVPDVVANGASIAMSFKFPEGVYKVLATAGDVNKITVALKTRSFLLTKTLATAEVTRASIVNSRAAVQFTGLKTGTYSLDIAALDGAGATLATATESTTVTEGQTATVNTKLIVTGAAAAATPANPTGGTGMNVNLEVVNG